LLAILATYSHNTIWWIKGDLHHDGGNTKSASRIWPLFCKADVEKFLNITVKVTLAIFIQLSE